MQDQKQNQKPSGNPLNLYLDAGILEIASLTDLPSQPINMRPAQGTHGFLGTQIQQIKTKAQPPVVDSAAPLQITRRDLGNGNLQFRVQFIAPTEAQDPNYQTTTVLLQTPAGSVRVQAAAGVGPIVFTSPKTTAPASAVLQQDNFNGRSEIGPGIGNGRALNQL